MSLKDMMVVEDSEDMQVKIANVLIDTEDNLEAKTQINSPLAWSALKMIQDKLVAMKMKKSAQVVEKFIRTTFKYYISHERKSRKEFIELVNSLRAAEQDKSKFTEKMGV